MTSFFDTHAHYDDERYSDDRDALIGALPQHGIALALNPGSSMASSRASVKLAEQYPHIYSAVGVHPHDAESLTDADLDELKSLSACNKVMAIGEIGLDYHYDNSPREAQRRAFELQLKLASEVSLPVIIHDREAHADTLDVLRGKAKTPIVYHCYSGSVEQAKILLDMGCYLSFNGIITFKNARKSHEVVSYMPIDRLLLETDAPYLAPDPHRGKRNDSTYLPLIAEAIASIRGTTAADIAERTYINGVEFFGIS